MLLCCEASFPGRWPLRSSTPGLWVPQAAPAFPPHFLSHILHPPKLEVCRPLVFLPWGFLLRSHLQTLCQGPCHPHTGPMSFPCRNFLKSVCMVCMHVHTCTHTCMLSGAVLRSQLPCFLETGLITGTWGSESRLSWLASEPLGSSCLHRRAWTVSAQLQVQLLTWGAGDYTQALTYA